MFRSVIMAAQINECLADGSSKGLFASVLAFVEACREAELKAEEVDCPAQHAS